MAKSTAKKATKKAAKQSGRKQTSSGTRTQTPSSRSRAGEGSQQREGERMDGIGVVRTAREQFEELSGRAPESVSGLTRTDEGWRVVVDVVELSRVPRTTDVLGTYELELSADGEIIGYERRGRYLRSATSQE